MSKAEILADLPKLKAEDRMQVFERVCELQQRDLLHGVGSTPGESAGQALAEFERDGNPGEPWPGLAPRSGLTRAVNWRVSIRANAKADLRGAQEWYERQLPGLAASTTSPWRMPLTRLEAAPVRFPITSGFPTRVLTALSHKRFRPHGRRLRVVLRILHAAATSPASEM